MRDKMRSPLGDNGDAPTHPPKIHKDAKIKFVLEL